MSSSNAEQLLFSVGSIVIHVCTSSALMFIPTRREWLIAACILFMLPLAGCGHNRSSLEGQVTWEGKPIPDGTIRLFPESGSPGRGGFARIKNGHYSLPHDQGLFASKYRVEIRAQRKDNSVKRMPAPENDVLGLDKVAQNTMLEYIPEKYNDASQLSIDLKSGVNQKNWELHP